MTQTQRSELERAIERAHKYGLFIAARGTRKVDGARVWGVTSHSKQHSYELHQVVQIGQRLECDCAARVYCSHKALVHEDLMREHAASTAAQHIEQRLATMQHQPAQARSVEPREWKSVAYDADPSDTASAWC